MDPVHKTHKLMQAFCLMRHWTHSWKTVIKTDPLGSALQWTTGKLFNFPRFSTKDGSWLRQHKGWYGKLGPLRWCLLPGAVCYHTDQLCSVPPAHPSQATWTLQKWRAGKEGLEARTYLLLYFFVKSKWGSRLWQKWYLFLKEIWKMRRDF